MECSMHVPFIYLPNMVYIDVYFDDGVAAHSILLLKNISNCKNDFWLNN